MTNLLFNEPCPCSVLDVITPQDVNVYTFTIVLPYDPLVNKKSLYSPNME